MARTCRAGSALVGPTMKAFTPSWSARFLMPASIALNQGIPPTFTTTPITGLSGEASAKPVASANAVMPTQNLRISLPTMSPPVPVRAAAVPRGRQAAFLQFAFCC